MKGLTLCICSPEPPASRDQVSGQAGLPSSMAALSKLGMEARRVWGSLVMGNSSFVDKRSLSVPGQVSQL